MKHVVGTVTIGQTPRTDVIPELSAILGDVTIREAGALDGLSRAEIAGLAPQRGDYVLVTRLADGSSVQVAERRITPRVAAKIKEHFDAGVPLVLLLCTGEFPEFPEGGLLVRPQRVLFHVVRAVAEGKRLGILTPSADQVPQSEERWRQLGGAVKSVPASPYVDAEAAVERASRELGEWGAELLILDCIGYSESMRRAAGAIAGVPAVSGRGMAARVVWELLG